MRYMHCGALAHFSHAVRDVLSDTSVSNGYVRRGPSVWSARLPEMIPLDCYVWGHLKILVHAASVDTEEALHHRIVDACQTTCNYPGIFQWM
jgi:hypothetical protein